jgi:pilus assembly protein CpaF
VTSAPRQAVSLSVHLLDGELIRGVSRSPQLGRQGLRVVPSAGNNRHVLIPASAIRFVLLNDPGDPHGTDEDPREREGRQRVVLRFLDGKILRTYVDEAFQVGEEALHARIWELGERRLRRAQVPLAALKGVFLVASWDSRPEAERSVDFARRRTRAVEAEPPALQSGPAAPTANPKIRALATALREHLAEVPDAGLASRDPEVFERALRRNLQRLLLDRASALDAGQRESLIQTILRDAFGFGAIDGLLRDPSITEIMVNAPGEIFIERDGLLVRSPVSFTDEHELLEVIRRMVAGIGRRIDESTPMVDARLPDGSRINAIIPPAATKGPALTVRKFRPSLGDLRQLVLAGSLSEPMASFLEAAVRGRLNVVISGGTGSGKTTTLNALGSLIPQGQRVITIEDSAELQIRHPNLVSLEYRPPNVEGTGELTIRQLLRNSLRMRPDRLVVGEVRGAEAVDMLQAMNTGHDGSMSTVHANSARDALLRMETMVMSGAIDLPLHAVRAQMASAIDLIVHQARLADGTRKVMQVSELVGYDAGGPVLRHLFVHDDGFTPTGEVPECLFKLRFHGVRLPVELFQAPATAAAGASPLRVAANGVE